MLGFQTVRDGSFFFPSESSQPVGSLGHEADLRRQQQDTSNSGVADIHRLFNWLSETLANARHSDASLTDTVNKALGLSSDDAYEEMRQKHEYELSSTLDKKEYEQSTGAKIENARFKDTQSPLLDIDPSSLKYPVGVSTSEVGTDHKFHLKEVSLYDWIIFVCFCEYLCEREMVGVLVFLLHKEMIHISVIVSVPDSICKLFLVTKR